MFFDSLNSADPLSIACIEAPHISLFGLDYQGKDVVFRFIIQYIKKFWPIGSRSVFI